MRYQLIAALTFPALVHCQQAGASDAHPTFLVQHCNSSSGCVSQTNLLTLDANWRWLRSSKYTDCYQNGAYDPAYCPDPITCAKNCALEGVNATQYVTTYGVNSNGGNLTLLLFPKGGGVGSRLYLLGNPNGYRPLMLKNQEFSFDVDVSGLPCGANGAIYLTSMAADGGKSAYPNNVAGAPYGTGYCDAQCPRDIKFINGEANLLDWNGSVGRYGTCCHEVDLWEANSASTAYTAHSCNVLGQTRCDSQTTQCGQGGYCDPFGCDFNPYRMGNKTFYGYGGTVKTNAPNKMRVVTQFITNNGLSTGTLTEIRRFYIQGGKVIQNAVSKVAGVSSNSLSDGFCQQQKSAFGETNVFASKGGMTSMDKALGNGMVLTMSIWLDYSAQMLWLDSNYPSGGNPATPGVARGSCPTTSGDPNTLRSQYPNAQVTFSNIKWGDISTTFGPPYP